MERNDNHLNNTLNLFAMLNFKEEEKATGKSEKNRFNIKKLWNLALEPNTNQKELNEILADKELSEIFYKILKDTSLFYYPKAKAAASTSINRRSKYFEIISIISKKDPKIVYIKFKFLIAIDIVMNNLYVGKDSIFISRELPKMLNNEIQFVLNVDDDLYKLIQDPHSEIFVR